MEEQQSLRTVYIDRLNNSNNATNVLKVFAELCSKIECKLSLPAPVLLDDPVVSAHSWVCSQCSKLGVDTSGLSFAAGAPDSEHVSVGDNQLHRMHLALFGASLRSTVAISDYANKMHAIEAQLHALAEQYDASVLDRCTAKAELKRWIADFQQKNGRRPDNSELEAISHVFESHRKVML